MILKYAYPMDNVLGDSLASEMSMNHMEYNIYSSFVSGIISVYTTSS